MANETLIDSVEDKRTLKDIVDPYLPRKKHVVPALEWMLPSKDMDILDLKEFHTNA